MTIEGATDTEVFRTYVDAVLCPSLKAGDIVIMDVSVVPSAVHMDLRRRIHSGHIGGIYDRYDIRPPDGPTSRCEPAASWPG